MKRALSLGLLAIVLAWRVLPAPAAEPATIENTCLNASGIQEALITGHALKLAEIRRKLKGDIVKADLCHNDGKLAYLVTILTPEGMVRRITIDAGSGEMLYAAH